MEVFASAVVFKELLTWRAIIDVFLITAGFYLLYRTLLGLGTWKIVTGIFVAIVFFLVANLLDLRGIEWIFNNISQVAVIALIIIFQPEIRKLLERAASLRRLKSIKYGDEFSQTLSEATFAMAEKRQGAIIVLPGKDPIDAWLTGGYSLDASPSLPLILSIFDPNSPGHDGALIVQGDKFTRFGVRLPLSQSTKLSEQFGTRHHAAMGLAEQTDALAIVVSEERGKVSAFVGGDMKPVSSPEMLVKVMLDHWKGTSTYPIELPRNLPRPYVLTQLMASLAIALFFYSTLVIAQGEILEKVVTVPVEYTASPPNLVLVGSKDNEVRLHLSGQKSDLDSLNPDQLSVKIDLAKAVAGKQSFLITGENLKLPRGVNLLDVAPQSIELELAQIVEQEVAIEPQLVGKLPLGLKIRSIRVMPRTLNVLSPVADEGDAGIKLITTPIYLEGISEDSVIFCKIIAPPSVQPAEKRWPDVQVSIFVERQRRQ